MWKAGSGELKIKFQTSSVTMWRQVVEERIFVTMK